MSERASHLIIGGVDLEIWDTVARNGIGAPAVASTVAAMTDTSKVYVYTGSESGYTAGNWYYYNGSAWVSGGVYNSTAFETDETLTEQGAAADAKAVGDVIADIQSALVNKANVDGAYEQMTVGNAEQLVSNVGIEDSVPYNFRTSGGSADIGDREVDKIVGGTIAWNQHIQNGNFAENAKWVKLGSGSVMTIANGECAVTPAANYDGIQSYNQTFNIANGHKWFIAATLKADSARTLGFGISDWSSHYTVRKSFAVSTTYEEKAFIGAETEGDTQNGVMMVYDTQGSAGVKFYIKNCIVIDLTQMFGSTIADYIYSLEQSTAGAGVALFKKLFPKPYYAYNAGELMSVQTSAHKMVGFNAWDEQWEAGGISTSTGENIASSGNSRTKNYIPVIPSTAYYFKSPVTLGLRFYDANMMIIGDHALSANSLYTMPSGCHYLRFVMVGVTQYANNICVNLSWDGERDGEYEEYKQWVYPLDSDLVLRGIPKLSSGNDLYYDGDTYESDGTVTRKYGTVTFDGSNDEYWSARTGVDNEFYVRGKTADAFVVGSSTQTTVIGIVSNRLVSGTWKNYNIDNSADIALFYGQPWIIIRVAGVTDVASLRTWLAANPLIVTYLLAAPTTESADPYQNPQIVDDFGTEEYVDSRDVAIPVGHDTFYQSNLKAKLEMAPNSPDGDGDYVVRQTNGQNEYVPLLFPASDIPAAPSENGNYVLKCTVTDGTPSFSWTAES